MKTKFPIILFLLISSFIQSQTKVADKFFERYAYVKASELYKEAYDDGDNSLHVLTRLGDCYYNNSNSKEAAKWYAMALDEHKDVNPEYIYKYIQTLRSLGDYEKAQEWLNKFNNIEQGDERAELVDISVFDDLTSTNNVNVNTNNLEINSVYSDFGSFIYNNTLYFASSRGSALSGSIYKWNEEPFLDIFQANMTKKDDSLKIDNIDLLASNGINTPFHEATLTITNDGKTLYFTRDNVKKGKKLGYDKKGTSHLKIYRASLENGIWRDAEDLSFNDNLHSTGHPTLSPDNKKLYFVSDRPGGKGQTDIYYVDIMDDGSFSQPKALEFNVNTEGREMFPFVDKNNILYFSSDGHVNIGLLDIFKVDLNDPNAKPENLGAPYNSGYDDFAYFSNDDGQGFFSSNRPGGKGSDDIYSFKTFECKQIVNGVVRDEKTGEPLNNALVELINQSGKIIASSVTSYNGEYSFEVECDKTYVIKGAKADYKDDLMEFTSSNQLDFVNQIDLKLTPLIRMAQIVINPIFFDFDKWNIRADAKYELENIVDVMRNHPNMVIKIESHTDSRGSDRYNKKLSDKRAKSTRDYIISRGIDPTRIESAIGYGESQLLNECEDGVKCSEEKHQENRRSYFYILKE